MKNKILTGLLSLLVAFALWVYVITVVSPGSEDTYYNIPVILQGESVLAERGLMITEKDSETVTLKLAGNRTDLSKLNSSNTTVIVDVSKIYDPGAYNLSYDVDYPGDIPDNAVSVQSHTPDAIRLVVEERVTKAVDIVISYSGNLPEGFIKEKEELDYTQVTVSGPKSVVDRIAQAVIPVDLTDRSQTMVEQLAFSLCDAAGEPVDAAKVKVDLDAVTVTVPIKRWKEITLRMEVIPGGGATEQTSFIEITPATIKVSGSESLLDGLEELVLGTVNLGEILDAETRTYDIKLPEGITNETGITQATVQIDFPELSTKTFKITHILPVNVPEGLKAEIATQELEVKIRGPKEVIENLTEKDVVVNVDFTGAQAGTDKFTAQIVINSAYSEAGGLSTYTVMATLSPEDSE